MIKVKKIITGGFEAVVDSAKQIGKAVSPGEMVKQAVGQQKGEFTNYLQSLDKNLSAEELEKKKQEIAAKEKEEFDKAKRVIAQAIPPHMRLPEKPRPVRPYEEAIQEEERKKAQAVETQKKQPQPLSTPTGKQPRGMLFPKRKQPKGFEGLMKDTRVG